MTRDQLKEFLYLARRFRQTPIVDDDFPLLRDRFDRELAGMIAELEANDAVINDPVWGDVKPGSMKVEVIDGKVVLRLGSMATIAELTPEQAHTLGIVLANKAVLATEGE